MTANTDPLYANQVAPETPVNTDVEPLSEKVLFLLRELQAVLPPHKVKSFERLLAAIASDEQRFDLALDFFAGEVQGPPLDDEKALYTEMIEMIAGCREREWGMDSHQNLIDYLERRAIPLLAQYAEGEPNGEADDDL